MARVSQSSVELVELGVKPRGPPRKAKYSLTTDSVPVGRLKDEKFPGKGSEKNLKPRAYKRSEDVFGRLTACLLHNEPAS